MSPTAKYLPPRTRSEDTDGEEGVEDMEEDIFEIECVDEGKVALLLLRMYCKISALVIVAAVLLCS